MKAAKDQTSSWTGELYCFRVHYIPRKCTNNGFPFITFEVTQKYKKHENMWKTSIFFIALICKESCPIFPPKTISKGQDEGQRKAILSLYSQIPATGSYTRGGYCQKLSRSGSKIHRLWNGRRCRWPHIRKSEANTCLQKTAIFQKRAFEGCKWRTIGEPSTSRASELGLNDLFGWRLLALGLRRPIAE